MNPLVKRLVTALAIKEAWDRVQEMRQPKKPSIWARLGKFSLFAGAGGSLFYLFKSGKLPGLKGSSSSNTSTWSYDEDRMGAQGSSLGQSAGSTGSSGGSGAASTAAEPGATTARSGSAAGTGAPPSPGASATSSSSTGGSKTEERVGSDK